MKKLFLNKKTFVLFLGALELSSFLLCDNQVIHQLEESLREATLKKISLENVQRDLSTQLHIVEQQIATENNRINQIKYEIIQAKAIPRRSPSVSPQNNA